MRQAGLLALAALLLPVAAVAQPADAAALRRQIDAELSRGRMHWPRFTAICMPIRKWRFRKPVPPRCWPHGCGRWAFR